MVDTGDLKSDFFKGHLIENLLRCNGFSIELSPWEAQLPPELPPNFEKPARHIFKFHTRRYGGIGRHSRLKICQRRLCTGSSPVSGTN